jgi:serine/threonine protein kinase
MTDKVPKSGPFGRLDPSLPQVFGRYLLIQRLSRGGMGEIFLAKHGLAGFEKLAVIKKVLPHLAADAQFISRFVDEAQVAIKLQHVNVAQVFEVGRVGDEYFLALEYIEGRDLRRTLGLLGHRKQRLPVDLALFIGRELANGLAYAHRRTGSDGSSLNLVHCDISPPNVLVSFEGETKVIDFGIAKSALRGTATDPKMGFGKFGYMAPEQLIRGGVVDARTDIYAAGVVLYELLTGQRLYEAGPEPDYRALAKKVARGEHPLPSEIDPSLGLYDDLVATALRPASPERYQSAAEFRDAIQQALVAVNPTISTDQLGAYMRDLFAEEMTAQKELHERVANAHLSDFQEIFHTQTISTVSFAIAQLRSEPSAVAPLPKTPTGRRTGNESAVRPSPALDTMAPPTSALPADSLSDLPGTLDGTTPRSSVESRSGRGRALALAGAAAVIVVAVVAFAMRRGDARKPIEPAKMSDSAAQARPQTSAITVVPIDPLPPPAKGAGEIEMKPDRVVPPPPPPPARPPRAGRHDPRRESRDTARADKPDGPTSDAVSGRFAMARRQYSSYREKNGGRLEKDFNDLMTFMQFQFNRADEASRKDAMRRIDTFLASMRE